eukprot:3939368-Rhodomonas_salina.1
MGSGLRARTKRRRGGWEEDGGGRGRRREGVRARGEPRWGSLSLSLARSLSLSLSLVRPGRADGESK